jgi:hypothetical protein
MKFNFNLQLFDEDMEIGVDTANVGSEERDTTPADNIDSKPFATFPDEATFMKRVSREGRKQFNDLLKELGFEDKTQLQNIIKDTNARKEAEKSELEKLQDTISNLSKDNENYKNNLSNMQKQRMVEQSALELNISSNKLDYIMKLIDTSVLETKEDVEIELNKLLEIMPEFRSTKTATLPTKTGADFKDSTKGKQPLTDELIRKMSTSEVALRLDEITEFLSSK